MTYWIIMVCVKSTSCLKTKTLLEFTNNLFTVNVSALISKHIRNQCWNVENILLKRWKFPGTAQDCRINLPTKDHQKSLHISLSCPANFYWYCHKQQVWDCVNICASCKLSCIAELCLWSYADYSFTSKFVYICFSTNTSHMKQQFKTICLTRFSVKEQTPCSC